MKMFWIEFQNILTLLSSFIFLFLSVFLATFKKNRTQSRWFLAVFLFSHSILLFDRIMIHYHAESFCVHLLSVGWPFIYLFSPMMYLYTRSMTDPSFRIQKWQWLHFFPFVWMTGYAMLNFYFLPAELKIRVYAPCMTMPNWGRTLFFALVEAQFFTYAILSLIQCYRYRIRIREFCSTIDRINLSWLTMVLYGFIAWRFVYFLIRYGSRLFFMMNQNILLTFTDTGFLGFACVLVWKGLHPPEIFPAVTDDSDEKKYFKSCLTDQQKKMYKEKLLQLMNTKRPYLIPSLSVHGLAQEMSIHPKHLSQIINELFRMNFYQFINHYRILEAKKRLTDATDPKLTILEVLYEVGFNSKSAFNRVFKEQTKITPTQFLHKVHQKE